MQNLVLQVTCRQYLLIDNLRYLNKTKKRSLLLLSRVYEQEKATDNEG